MTVALRICLLAGCLGLLLLDAPKAGALLAQGMAGPYREAVPEPSESGVRPARLPITPGSFLLSDNDPWSEGLPRGL